MSCTSIIETNSSILKNDYHITCKHKAFDRSLDPWNRLTTDWGSDALAGAVEESVVDERYFDKIVDFGELLSGSK